MVGCGAWSVPLLILAYFASAASTLTWSIAFYGLALFFNYPHYMATIYRAYHTEEDFRKYRIFTVHITLVLVATLVLSHFWIRTLPWFFTLYLTASPWHYSGQNYGLFMMFARRSGFQPSTAERRVLYAAFLLSYAILFLNFHTGPSIDPLFVSLNIPSKISLAAQIALAAAFVGCSVFGLSRLISRCSVRSVIPSLTLFSTQCIWFLVPALLSLAGRFAVPQSRYSTGILAVMHSAQYLWITSYYAKREATANKGRGWRPFAYSTILVAGGIALFVPGPWVSSLIFHFDFTRSFLLFTALVNIHHFILDGAIWKLRDGRISALLLNSRNQISEGAISAKDGALAAVRWLAGPASAARSLRIGTALALLAWGTIDQAHYYFSLQRENLEDLKHAASLAPYDTPLEMRVAERALEQGSPQESAIAWEYAIKADHEDSGPRDAYLRYLLQQKRFEEAYKLTSDWLVLAPNDVALLLNHGILAQQLGHVDDAENSWQRALAVDPSRADIDLLLAAALEQQNKLDPAIAHYEAYLSKMATRTRADLPPASSLIGVALKTAQCNLQAHHLDIAVRFYEMARTLAKATGEQKLEAFADIAEAMLDAKGRQAREALPLFQKALQLDATLDDRNTEAADWYSYGAFLRQSGFPARLAYASILKSQALPGTEGAQKVRSAAKQMQAELERELGPQASAIRRNPEPVWQAALALQPSAAQLKRASE